MHLRPAGETRIFHEGQGAINSPLLPSHHPKWFGSVLHGQASKPSQLDIVKKTVWLKRRIFWIPCVSFAITSLLVAGYASFYNGRIKPGVTVNNISLSGKNPVEARALIQKQADDFRVSVGTLGAQPAKPSQLGLSFDIDQTISSALSSGNLNPFSHRAVEFRVKLNQQILQKYLSSINKVNAVAISAKVEIGTDGTVKVISGQKGSSEGIEPVMANTVILAAARQGQSIKLNPTKFESIPPITTNYAETVRADIEKLITVPVSLSVDGHEQKTTSAQVASWITLTPHEEQKKINAVVDSVKVGAYLDAIAKPYVKPPRAKVVTKNDDGTTRVLSTGAPGTDITGKKEVAIELAASLNQGKGYTKPLPVAYAEPQTITAADYDKWIDVDLTNKRMYAYEHGTVIREFLISAGAPATPTVKGQFTIKSKVRRQDMRGFNADGSKYYQPNVEYINYFYQDYAIHGNYWRSVSAFGHTNLSHGCVGIVNTDAKWVYDWAPIGTMVITHD